MLGETLKSFLAKLNVKRSFATFSVDGRIILKLAFKWTLPQDGE